MKTLPLLISLVCATALGTTSEVMHDGSLVGISLFDGKVLANGNISGSAKYVLENCPVEEGVKYETRAGENSMLVKWTFPKALELRVQLDYGYGFPEASKVRTEPLNDDSVAATVTTPDGVKCYFASQFSTPYSRPSFFVNGKIYPWTGTYAELEGAAPAGISWECFYGIEGDDIQVATAFSTNSIADAAAILKAEQPDFLPMKRDIIWQYDDASFPPRKPMKGNKRAKSLKYIQRTMKKLADSSAKRPATVRVLFYGQSITLQPWNRLMMKHLQAKHPHVEFVWRNLALGGYESGALRDEFRRDVCTFYPDILFFHVYGSMECYEDMVRMAREETAAEIVLWTSHVNDSKADIDKLLVERDERSLKIREVAEKYHCHFIDLNLKWLKLLKENGWTAKQLVCDGIHLNGLGNMYYMDFIEEELIRTSGSGDEKATGSETFFPLKDRKRVKTLPDGTLEFTFDGNRVAAVSDGTAALGLDAAVLLDGRPLAGYPELWAVTRPTPLFAWAPALGAIDFGSKPPVAEDWTFELLPSRPGDPTNSVLHSLSVPGDGIPAAFSKFIPRRFKLRGSVTGDDGEGISTEAFVSKSGRIAISLRSWRRWPWGQGWSTILGPGAVAHWTTKPLFTDHLKATPAGTETLLLQGCSNGVHTISIKLHEGAASGIRGFKVWKPAQEAGK